MLTISNRLKQRILILLSTGLLTVGTAACVATSEDVSNLTSLFSGAESSQYEGGLNNPAPSCFAERFVQPSAEITRKIDILFIADTSGSIDQERGAIANGLDAFVGALPAQVDYRVGVMMAHGPQSQYSGKLWKYGNTPYVLDSQQLSLATIRSYLNSRMVHTANDSSTDGGEAGLFALHNALQPANLADSRAKGFFRADAALAVVFISDENDICAEYPLGVNPVPDPQHSEASAYQNICVARGITANSVYQEVRSYQNERPLLISAIIYNDLQTVPSGGENEYGYGYTNIVELSHSISVDLANGNYSQGLSQIGTLATVRLNLVSDFVLSRTPVDQSSIEVEVDGVAVGHSYTASSNEIHIDQPGMSESVVDLYYCLEPSGGGGSGSGGNGGGGIGV